jgi:hypothetical protein
VNEHVRARVGGRYLELNDEETGHDLAQNLPRLKSSMRAFLLRFTIISPSIRFLLKGCELGRGTWGSLIFSSYTRSDGGRVEECDELQEKVPAKIDKTLSASDFGVFLASFLYVSR